jgi:hypothetical protein
MECELRIFTPRWGHEDVYTVSLDRGSMIISRDRRVATCGWRDNLDPVWAGEDLEAILRNDSIYPPSILPRLLEHVWTSWRSSEIDDAAAEQELQALADWLNTITRAKPDTKFWRTYF